MNNILIPDLKLLKVKIIRDHRGHFSETFSNKRFADSGLDVAFVQDNISVSVNSDTVRGLHFQGPPHAQAKLVRCGRGAIFDVAVDIRLGSPTYGRWVGYELTADNGHQLYIPVGFAHGFITLETNSEIAYKCSDYYAPETEGAILWNDNDLGIEWPILNTPILSEKDASAPTLAELKSPFIYGENS